MQEQRRYIRYNAEGSVVLKLENNISHSIPAGLANIGFLGFGIETKEKIEVGTNVDFELITKLWDKPVIGKGKIIYVNEIKRYDTTVFRMGIEFLDVEQETIRCIINRIQEDICAQARRKKTF